MCWAGCGVWGGYERLACEIERVCGGYERLACGIERVRGGYERLAGGIERVRGGYERLAGGIERVRGGYERLAGEIERVRGGYERLAGEIERVCGGYERFRGSMSGQVHSMSGRPRQPKISAAPAPPTGKFPNKKPPSSDFRGKAVDRSLGSRQDQFLGDGHACAHRRFSYRMRNNRRNTIVKRIRNDVIIT